MTRLKDNDVVLGPSSIALAHLSLHDDARVPIVEAGAIARLVAQCRTEGGTGSPAVITQLAKTMASLSLKGEVRELEPADDTLRTNPRFPSSQTSILPL